MKPTFIAAIMLTLVVHLAPGSKAKEHGAEVAAKIQSQTPSALSPLNQAEKSKNDNQISHSNTPHWYKSPEWILIIVTAITAGFICWQAWETRQAASAAADSVTEIQRQAAFMERQAKAAEDSAKALIASQRAWLDGEFRQIISDEEWGIWELIAENNGSTPAQLLRHECSVHLQGQEFRWESWLTRDTRNWGTLIAAEETTEPLQRVIPKQIFTSLREQGNPGMASCLIGVTLVYTDVLNPTVEHMTRFLMLFNRVTVTLERLSQYNEYT